MTLPTPNGFLNPDDVKAAVSDSTACVRPRLASAPSIRETAPPVNSCPWASAMAACVIRLSSGSADGDKIWKISYSAMLMEL